MKSGLIFGLSVGLAMMWYPYSAFIPGPAGNPNNDSYVGQPDGVYDIAANPPKTIGVVTYNPYAPLPASNNAFGANGSASEAMPPALGTPPAAH